MKLTFIARDPTNPEADFLLSEDDLSEVAEVLIRSSAREVGPLLLQDLLHKLRGHGAHVPAGKDGGAGGRAGGQAGADAPGSPALRS